MNFFFLLFISLLFIIELLFYNVLKIVFHVTSFFSIIYTSLSVALILISGYLIYRIASSQPKERWPHILRFSSFFTLTFLPKFFIATLGLFLIIICFIGGLFFGDSFINELFISKTILTLSSIPFFAVLHGILIGRYNFKVIKETLSFNHLPAEFNGLKILQISDIHSGSLSNKEQILKGIELINNQKADLIVFTGDLINSNTYEMDNWIDVFSQIKKAPLGNYSILGNHDYGSHNGKIPSEKKESHLFLLKEIHQKIGFDLLLNQQRILEKNNQKINLLGVENYGAPPFPQYGDLTKTTENTNSTDFNILLSHDPSHFDLEVKDFEKNIALTLSGHTHGMQFGIEIFGFKWSPIKYKYPKWAGLYKENNRYLYVNRGFGYIGLPARIGIWPEITVITLKN